MPRQKEARGRFPAFGDEADGDAQLRGGSARAGQHGGVRCDPRVGWNR